MSAARLVFGVATATGAMTLLSRRGDAASKRDERVAKEQTAAAKAAADAAKAGAAAAAANAEAARATAEADKIKAETALRAQEAQSQADARKRADDAQAAAVKSADDSTKFWLSLGTTIAAAGAGLLVGKFMGKAGAQAIINRGNAVTGGLNELGKNAAKLLKSAPKGQISGTIAGDTATGILRQAATLERGMKSVGHVSKLDAALPALSLVSGAAETAFSFATPNEGQSMAARAAGTVSIVAGIMASKSLLTAHRSVITPGASNLAALGGLKARLAREAPKVKSPPTRPTGGGGGGGGVGSFQRTYKTGAKAGITETVVVRTR